MGFLSAGVCYPTITQAKIEHCASFQSNAVGFTGSDVHTASASCVESDFTASSFQVSRFLDGSLVATSSHPYPPFPSCEYDGFTAPAAEYFGALLAFLVVLAVAARLKNYFWSNHESI